MTGRAVEPQWCERGTITHAAGNLKLRARWNPAAGLRMRIAPATGTNALHITLLSKKGTVQARPRNAFPAYVEEESRFSLEALPRDPAPSIELVFKVRPEGWTLYAKDRPVVSFPAPFTEPVELAMPTDQLPAPDDRRVRFQKIPAEFRFEDDFLIPEDAELKLAQWEMDAGKWDLHTAREFVKKHEKVTDTRGRVPDAQHSPNFYSLRGAGTNALISAGHGFYDRYDMAAAVNIAPGEMGLAFYIQDTQSFFGLTIKLDEKQPEGLVHLWKRDLAAPGGRRVLGAVTSALTPNQWVRLRARAFDDRVQCFMDNCPLIDVPVELPAGGRFGLFVNGPSPARFDDVTVRPNHDLDLSDLDGVRRYAVTEHGRILPQRQEAVPSASPAGGVLRAAPDGGERWLCIGSPSHAPHIFEGTFTPEGVSPTFGLISGYTSATGTHYRFVCRLSAANEVFTLEKVAPCTNRVVEGITIPRTVKTVLDRPVRLTCDPTDGRALRLYRDGELVLVHHDPESFAGASGVYLGANTGARIGALDYRFQSGAPFRNRYEKNPLFNKDPYMLHWSSPEGQWIWFKDGTTWFKGDFFGRFSMLLPHVTNSAVHLGVGEGRTNGTLVVRADPTNVVVSAAVDTTNRSIIGRVPVSSLATNTKGRATYDIHRDGRWIWLSSNGKLLFKHYLARQLGGTRVRVDGFSRAHLALTRIDQYNVKDYLFTQSPYEWLINGGRWEVVNRFQCDPRWSHMNGESADGVAALWGKYRVRGDFCAEMYAATRHDTTWYSRAGDLNMTVMGDATSPSRGYTVTCTGWDFDQSRLLTRLYRNGTAIAVSDKYLVPRRRAGSVRRGYVPLVSKALIYRNMHRAWFYIKFRRIGKKLEYYFDNELVFSVEDDEPLDEGSFGIWTFMNSMVIARAKLAAEHIDPKSMVFKPISPAAALAWPPAPAPPPVMARDILNAGRPLDMTLPEHWELEDSVGHARMIAGVTAEGVSTFAVKNTRGSGPMFARCTLPPLPYDELAGWTFCVKRTPGAQFNVHYSVGTKKNGTYTPRRHYFHRISGTDFTKGDHVMAAETPVAGTPMTTNNWHTCVPWTPVDVWLPPLSRPSSTESGVTWLARFEGFGNLQPSYVLQGLHGNAPGEAYAVKGLTAVHYTKPALSLATNASAPISLAVLDHATGTRLSTCRSSEELQTWVDGHSATGLVRTQILHKRKSDTVAANLSWISLPAQPDVICAWSDTRPDSIELRLNSDFPDPRFRLARIASAGGHRLYSRTEGPDCRWAPLPRRADLVATNESASIDITVPMAGQTLKHSLAYRSNTNRVGPVLTRLKGLTPFLENYEQGGWGRITEPSYTRMRLQHHDPLQGRYYEVFNPGAAYKLKTTFSGKLYHSKYPVAQFRYRTGTMGYISMYLAYYTYVNLGEAYSRAKTVRYGKPLERDGQWHTWCGITADAMPGGSLSRSRYYMKYATLGSISTTDQTGRYSELALDDFVFGPAVSTAEQLTFTPTYFDFIPGSRVSMAVSGGPTPYHELGSKERPALRWHDIPNEVATTPSLEGLEDGVHHILLKATSADGITSPITDIPFLLDRGTGTVAHAFADSRDVLRNGTVLNIDFTNDGGSPLELTGLKLTFDGQAVSSSSFESDVEHTLERDRLALNWPYLLRGHLNAMTNGQSGKLVLSGIRDGAGNAVADHAIPIKVDYATDKTPPTLVSPCHPSNVMWCAEWEGAMYRRKRRAREREWGATSSHSVTLVRKPNAEPYLSTRTLYSSSSMWQTFANPHWDVTRFPNLAFRIRRPDMRTNDTSLVYLQLLFADKQAVSVALAGQDSTKKIPPLPHPMAWQSNVWHTVVLNIPELLTQLSKNETVKSTRITRVLFGMRNSRSRLHLNLQNVFAFAPWRPEDTVGISTYDASGVAGIDWGYAPATTGEVPDGQWRTITDTELTPAELPPPSAGSAWIAVRARDKAGNVSFATRIPLTPARK